jgi:hypothetical protein
VADVIQSESAESTAVFLGLQVPETGEEETYSKRLERLAGDLPVVFFVKNSSVFIGELLESPEAARVEQDAIDDPGPATDDARPLPD